MPSNAIPLLSRLSRLLSFSVCLFVLAAPISAAEKTGGTVRAAGVKAVKTKTAQKTASKRLSVAAKKKAGVITAQKRGKKQSIAAKAVNRNSKTLAKGKHARSRLVAVAPKRELDDTDHVTAAKPSMAQAMGLHAVDDPLNLKSSVALVVDQNSHEVLFGKNTNAVLPIASITKLMTAMVVLDANLPLDDVLEVTEEDRDLEKGTSSRLRFGARLTREEMLLLALMSSENRAASALGRNYPGGRPAFVQAMNRKAASLGMRDTFFVDSNGLSSQNVSSANDLAKMVEAAYKHPLIRQFSTQPDRQVEVAGHMLNFVNTNRLVRGGEWDIGVQKTGYISEAGRCLVMQAHVQGRPVLMVFLDSVGKLTRFADASRVRNWLESSSSHAIRKVSSPQIATPPVLVPGGSM